jgi:hypothetical protein
MNSRVVENFKVAENNDYYGKTAGITSGRNIFWQYDWEAYSQWSLFKQIFGDGFRASRAVNFEKIGSYIYAHNDVLNLILCNGALGLIM